MWSTSICSRVVTVTDADARRTALDRRRDLRGWLITPAVTLLLAPILTAGLGFLMLADSDSYPRFCYPVVDENGCQEAIFAMFVLHARVFAVGWLLLWALPWWRGLRPYRAWLAVAAGAALLASPLRLMDWSAPYEAYHIDQLFGQTSTEQWDFRKQAAAAIIAVLAVVAAVVTSVVLLLRDRRRKALAWAAVATLLLIPGIEILKYTYHPWEQYTRVHVVQAPDPQCVTHSGRNDKCPGG